MLTLTPKQFINEAIINHNYSYVIHTPTEELLRTICNILDNEITKISLSLKYDESICDTTTLDHVDIDILSHRYNIFKDIWETYKENTCIGNDCTFCDLEFAQENDYKIFKIKTTS